MKVILIAVTALLYLGITVEADVFNMGPGLTSLETVVVGDPGNVSDYGTVLGAVSYSYRMSKYEVTTAQYVEFLNNRAKSDPYGLYNPAMSDVSNYWGCNIQREGSPGDYSYKIGNGTTDVLLWGNRPVNYIGFWDAVRFANWLNNGQGTGDTETGAYNINGYTGEDGSWIGRNPDASWFLPSENEWYKAAYYKGGGTNSDYWFYPTKSFSEPDNRIINPDQGNNANYQDWSGRYTVGSPYYRTNVGEFENSESTYGTFDQGGNVWEWNEAVYSSYHYRHVRGGSFFNTSEWLLSTRYSDYSPTNEATSIGFRIAAAIPEPSGLLILLWGLCSAAALYRRR